MEIPGLLPNSLSTKARYTPHGQSYKFKFPTTQYTNIDDYLSKIGFGLYQIRAYLVLGFVLINDGAEVIVLSFLMAILNKEWGLTSAEIGFLGSAVFAGFLVGSLFTGKISDQYGRKKSLIYVVLLLYVFAMWSAFTYSYGVLVFVRTIFGFLVGFQFPMCYTYLAEITPKEGRGKYLVLAGGFFTLGELLACFIGFFTLDSTSSGNWRALFVWVAQPALLSCLGIVYLMHESPRYEIVVRKNYKEGTRILGIMALANGVGIELDEEDEAKLQKWVESKEDFQQEEVASVSALFKGKNKRITLLLWPIWMILSLVYYGMVYILPLTLSSLRTGSDTGDVSQENSDDIWNVVLAIISELPSIALGYLIIERSIMGRKNSIIWGFVVCGLACLLAGLLNSFVLWVSVARGIVNCVFIIVPAYTTELYTTNIRATGLGMASAASRIGGVIMPWIALGLFQIGPTFPYIGFFAFCALGAYCCYLIPLDTTNKELDFDLENRSSLTMPLH